MKKALHLLLLLGLLFGQPVRAQSAQPGFTEEEMEAARRDPRAFEIDPLRVRLVHIGRVAYDGAWPGPEPRPGGAAAMGPPSSERGRAPFAQRGVPVDPGTIINIGKEAWRIIEANRPVVDIKQSYATALPGGTTHWNQLTGWGVPVGDVYELEAGNFWGWTVIKVRFQVLRASGGNWRGIGRYLTTVTTEPQLVDVFWGYRFSMEGVVPKETVLNAGNAQEPMGALTHALRWRIGTAIKEMRGSHVFYMQGDGIFKQIGSPNMEPGPARHFRLPEAAPQVPVWE